MMKRTVQALLALLLIATMILSAVGCGVKPVNNPNGGTNNGANNGGNNDDNTTTTTAKGQESVPPVKLYSVTFDYNDGSGQKTTLSVPEGSLIGSYAMYPSSGNREVIAWSALPDGAEYTAGVTQDITLYAIWQTFEVVSYTADTLPTQINDRCVELQFTGNQMILSGKVLRIGAGVRSVSIVSDGTIYQNTSIIINNRSGDLSFSLDNFSFSSNQKVALQAEGSGAPYTLSLNIKNTCVIDCSATVAESGANGVTCIQAPNLKIAGSGKLALIAGHGGNGASKPLAPEGNHGENGENATAGGCGIVASSVEVAGVTLNIIAGNGGHGGNGGGGNNSLTKWQRDGGDGGNGGNGGHAVVTDSFKSTNATLNLSAGTGGNGGRGGNAGGVFGNSGIGGNGGRGGDGGDVFKSGISDYQEISSVRSCSPGTAGAGGKGGNTPDGGSWANGHDGANGKDGRVNAD